ncbi:MAG: hypothetical protein H6550_09515 [Chitinophagales bacterium]|nr:hypothetical protein [Chitinophagales bacterium]
MNVQELQNQVNQELLNKITELSYEINNIKSQLSELTSIVAGINDRSTAFVPHIMSSYMTLIETEFGAKVQSNFEEIERNIAQSKGGSILGQIFDDAPGE